MSGEKGRERTRNVHVHSPGWSIWSEPPALAPSPPVLPTSLVLPPSPSALSSTRRLGSGDFGWVHRVYWIRVKRFRVNGFFGLRGKGIGARG